MIISIIVTKTVLMTTEIALKKKRKEEEKGKYKCHKQAQHKILKNEQTHTKKNPSGRKEGQDALEQCRARPIQTSHVTADYVAPGDMGEQDVETGEEVHTRVKVRLQEEEKFT